MDKTDQDILNKAKEIYYIHHEYQQLHKKLNISEEKMWRICEIMYERKNKAIDLLSQKMSLTQALRAFFNERWRDLG